MSNTPKAKKQLAEAQAASEGVPSGDKVEFLGKMFRLSDEVGYFSLMKFSYYADRNEYIGPAAAAIYGMLRDTIHPDDWDDFEHHAVEQKARGQDFGDVITKTMEILTARPTRSPSGSSSSPSPASES